MKMSAKITIGILCIIAAASLSAVFGRQLDTKSSAGVRSNTITPKPTPFEFQEMTIPYLRSQEYQSEITQEYMIANGSGYTSYRVSYFSEGFKIYGLLTVPTGDAPTGGWPAVIFLHGYIPPTIYKTTQQYAAYTDQLSKNGFVVFKPDFRGHDKSEGEARGAYYSSDYVIDALHAYDALSKYPDVNPNGIGLWGHSMSGNISMRVFAVRPTIPAVVIWAGAVYTYADMREFSIQDGSYRPPPLNTQLQQRRQKLRELYGDFSADSWFWKQVAITEYLSDLQGAVQIHHAVNDDVVNIGYSRNLLKLLEAASVPHEVYEYPDGGHNIQGTAFITAFERTIAFFKQRLR